MLKTKKLKVLLDQSDFNRALLSDTTPAELPIPIGNEGFYLNIRDKNKFDSFTQEMIQAFILPSPVGKRPSNPYYYKIVKDANSLRKLGLPHPRSQLEICDFYSRYASLLLYYCGRSSYSIRRPVKIGGSYYIAGPGASSNEVKFSTISTVDKEKFTKHPASFFSYSGFDRLHKFFNSRLYDSLERKFSFLSSQDISKCFPSIYTHSISWATRSEKESKDNTSSEMYGASFDRLMQSMNKNETNGIVIGPEVSRIFAETVLSCVDRNLELRLLKKRLVNGLDYAAFRYVDNYYFFCRNAVDCERITDELSECLEQFKLYLNASKGETISRPFANSRSSAMAQANSLIRDLVDNLTDSAIISKSKVMIPRRIISRHKLMGALVQRTRNICVDCKLSYEAISGYLLAAIKRRARSLISDSELVLNGPENFSTLSGRYVRRSEYLEYTADLLEFYLEISFHLFALHPNVNASLDISHVLVQVADFLKKRAPDEFLATREKVQLWMFKLVSGSSLSKLDQREHATSVEILNIVCATKPFDLGGQYYVDLIERFSGVSSKIGYFELIAKIFVLGSDPLCKAKVVELANQAEAFILEAIDLTTCSQRVHLFFDLMSCPHIPELHRRKMVRRILEAYNVVQQKEAGGRSIRKPTNSEIDAAVSNFQLSPWFTTWESINLLRLIEKKEWKRAYG